MCIILYLKVTTAEIQIQSLSQENPSNESLSETSSVLSFSDSQNIPKSHPPQQITIDNSFASVLSWAEGGAKYAKISNSILYMVCRDYQPISIVENEGFKNLIRVLAPHYVLPSRRTIKRRFDDKYEAISNTYRLKIKDIPSFTLTN